MKTIAYLLYGSRREYHLELTYSVLSAAHFIGGGESGYQIALITDEAGRRTDLPVEHLIFSPDEFLGWTRAGTYMHAAKAHALIKAMDHFRGPVALIDTDTYFLAHPQKLFERVAPGKSVMNAFEGTLGQYDFWRPLIDRVSQPVAGYRVAADSKMINSGVVGLDFSDRKLLDDVVPLINELYAIHPIFNIEQFAFAAVLSAHTEVAVCPDVIYHYWGYERGFFHSQIGELFPTFSAQLFARHVGEPPRLGFPKKHRADQLRAAVVSRLRRHSADYRFAYLAYLCALRQSEADGVQAKVWADIALTVLKRNDFPAEHIRSDFGKMRRAPSFQWLDPQSREDWSRYWPPSV